MDDYTNLWLSGRCVPDRFLEEAMTNKTSTQIAKTATSAGVIKRIYLVTPNLYILDGLGMPDSTSSTDYRRFWRRYYD